MAHDFIGATLTGATLSNDFIDLSNGFIARIERLYRATLPNEFIERTHRIYRTTWLTVYAEKVHTKCIQYAQNVTRMRLEIALGV